MDQFQLISFPHYVLYFPACLQAWSFFFYWTLDSEIFTLLGIGYFCNPIFWNFVLEYIYITEIQFNKFSQAWMSPRGSGRVLSPELIIPPNLSKSLPTVLWMVFQPENFVWLMENNLSIILHELQIVFLRFFAGGYSCLTSFLHTRTDGVSDRCYIRNSPKDLKISSSLCNYPTSNTMLWNEGEHSSWTFSALLQKSSKSVNTGLLHLLLVW